MPARRGGGTMSEVAPGKWRLRVYAGRDRKGNPVQASETFIGSESQASKRLAALVTKTQDRSAEGATATVGQLLDRWLEHITPTRRATTLLSYRRKIEHDIRPAIGHVRLARLSARDLDKLYAAGLARGLSTTTIHQWHAILSAALRQAERWDWLERNPARKASPPAAKRPSTKTPTPREVAELVQTAQNDDPVLAGAIALAALTGARRGELCALRWSDVSAGRVVISRSVSVVGGKSSEGPTKTHQSRTVTLGAEGEAALAIIRAGQEKLAVACDVELPDDAFVLSYQTDGSVPVCPDTLTHKFARISKGRWRFHDLRHFSATTLIAAGVDVRTVAERLGHAQATMTLNRYAHALPERDRNAADVLGRALNTG